MMKRTRSLLVIACLAAITLPLVSGCSDGAGSSTGALRPDAPAAGAASATAAGTGQATAGPASAKPAEPEVQLQEKQAAAPALPGAEKRIAESNGLQRILYVALPDNPYGLETGAIAGEYKHEVYLGATRTGGVALAAPAAQHCLQAALATRPQQDRWLLPLPVDLSDCRSLRPVVLELSARPLADRPYCVRIAFEQEQLGIVNMLDAQQKVTSGDFLVFGLRYVVSRRIEGSPGVIPGEEMAFLFMLAKFQSAPAIHDFTTFGDRLGMTREPVLAGLTSVRGPFREHTFDCILKLDGCPVFLMANRTS